MPSTSAAAGDLVVDVNAVDECRSGARFKPIAGKTALHLACAQVTLHRPTHYTLLMPCGHDTQGHIEVARLLLDAKADILLNDGDACTPLHHACATGLHELVEMLLETAAAISDKACPRCLSLRHVSYMRYVSLQVKKALVDDKDEYGKTALINTCQIPCDAQDQAEKQKQKNDLRDIVEVISPCAQNDRS